MENSSDEYLSIDGESQGVYREKASKFIAIAVPVSTEDEVKLKLDALRKQFHDANHHCFAYRIGNESPIYRSNDDGEPSGSAGKPIYGQILSTGLSDILIVVIRYFGGTKLGIPGLIHAYRTSAREAIDQAVIIKKTITINSKVIFDYESMNQVMRILKDEHVKIQRQTTEERCTIEFQVRKSSWPAVESRLTSVKKLIMDPIPFSKA